MKTTKLLALLSALIVGGCATVKISSPGSLNGVKVHGACGQANRAIMVSNDGYYLFQHIPLVAGDVTWDEEDQEIADGIKLFSHQLSGDAMMGAMSHYAESLNCDLVNIVINNKSECGVSFLGIGDFFSTIVGNQAITYSGVLVPKNTTAAKGALDNE